MQSRRGSCHYPCKQTSTVGLLDATALFRAGFCCSAAQCYHFLQRQFYDPGKTRTCNLWFRRPMPHPLGHITSSNTGSRPLELQLQIPPSTRTCKIRNVPMKNYGGPCMRHWFSTWKNGPLFGGRQSWPFCQIASIKGLRQGCNRFLCF